MFLQVSTIICISLLARLSIAAPATAPHSLIVFNPRITSPKPAVAWTTGSEHDVTWDVAQIPVERLYTTGLVLLGHMANGSENLNISHPLASGFPIKAGCVRVVMPIDAVPRDDYFVVLFGDSGNKSPKFKISRD